MVEMVPTVKMVLMETMGLPAMTALTVWMANRGRRDHQDSRGEFQVYPIPNPAQYGNTSWPAAYQMIISKLTDTFRRDGERGLPGQRGHPGERGDPGEPGQRGAPGTAARRGRRGYVDSRSPSDLTIHVILVFVLTVI